MPTMDFECYLRSDSSDVDPVDEMLELQDAAGIELAVVMPPLQDPPDDGWLAERIKGQPRLLGCALINPLMGVEAVANLERSINDFGFRGMKLMPAFYHYHIESEVVDPVMSKAAELRVPVTIHSGSSFCLPAQIGLLAGRHPDVTVIMDHMGYRDYVGQAIAVANLYPNVFLGSTLANVEPATVLKAMHQVGPDRVVYGSNATSAYPDLAVAGLKRLRMDPVWERMLLGENLARIYRVI